MTMILLLTSALLTLVAYYSGRKDSFLQAYELEINTFKTHHFSLGVISQEWDSERDGVPCKVDEVVIGLFFLQWRVEFYKALDSQEAE